MVDRVVGRVVDRLLDRIVNQTVYVDDPTMKKYRSQYC